MRIKTRRLYADTSAVLTVAGAVIVMASPVFPKPVNDAVALLGGLVALVSLGVFSLLERR